MQRLRTIQKIILLVLLPCGLVGQSAPQGKIYVELLKRVEAFKTAVTLGVVSNSSNLIAAISQEKVLKVFDANTLAERWATPVPEGSLSALQFSPDGSLLLAGTSDGQILGWNTQQGTLLLSLKVNDQGISALGVTKERLALTGSLDRTVTLVDIVSKKILTSVSVGKEEITGLAVNPPGDMVAVATSAGTVKIFSVPQLSLITTVTEGQTRISPVMFSADGKRFMTGAGDGRVIAWDLQTWKLTDQIAAHGGSVTALAVDPESRWVVSTAVDSSLKIHTVAPLSVAMTFPPTDGSVSFLGFANKEALCIGFKKGELKLWRVLEAPPDRTPPVISIAQPGASGDQPTPKIFATETAIQGIVYDGDDVKELAVNGSPVSLQPLSDAEIGSIPKETKGRKFDSTVKLESVGLNLFELKASDRSGNISTQRIQVQRLSNDQAVEVSSPANNSETDKVSTKLEFRAWFEIASYSISVNMQEAVEDQRPRSLKIGNPLVEEVPLVTGFNQVVLTVTGKLGVKITKSVSVTRKAYGQSSIASGIKPSAKERGAEPQSWAVVVGVSDYTNPGIKSLDYASKDAEAFADFLRRPEGGGYDDNHLKVLLNKDATLVNLRDALIIFLSQAIDKDLVIIYFAGHGAPEPARPANTYLLMRDTDPALLGVSAFPMWQIQDYLARYISAKRIVVFADACHSGAISVGYATRGASATESNLVNQYLSDLSKTKEGVVVFTASAAGEVSQELPEFGHGVFTHFLLKGMQGEADLNNDYTVTINELMQYVEDQVKRKTRGAQNPTRSQTSYDKELTMSVISH